MAKSGYSVRLLYDISSRVNNGQVRRLLTSVNPQFAQRNVCIFVNPDGKDFIEVEDMSSEVRASLSLFVKPALKLVSREQSERSIELIVLLDRTIVARAGIFSADIVRT